MLLLFSDDAQFGSDTATRLREHGLPVVSHDPKFAQQICEKVDFCGVILDGRRHPQKYEALSEALFHSYPELPMAFLVRSPSSVLPHADVILFDGGSESTFDGIQAFCRRCMGRENYSTYALQHLENTKEFTYLGYPMPLSDSEYRFLLCLFRRFPKAESTDAILSEAFPNSRVSRGTLRTLAARINRSSRAISGLRLIRCAYGMGYRLCNGIAASNQ